MLFLNHTLTGGLLGLTIDEPLVLVPAALGSHFVMDALPHFGYPELALKHQRWVVAGVIDGALSLLAVITLCGVAPRRTGHILLGVGMAVLPDLYYVPEVLLGWRPNHLWGRFHNWIQWGEYPGGLAVDAVWAAAVIYMISHQI
jgi:hypothetical protein